MFSRPHLTDDLKELDGLIRQLPFDLDDSDSVGRLYAQMIARGARRARYLVDLWTYCYVRRYFLVRFIRSHASFTSAELEAAVERAFLRIEKSRATLRDQERYPRWVIVVCRNTYLNFVSRRRDMVAVHRIAEPGEEDERVEELHDDAVRASALEAAIARLPRYLREVARLRLVQDLQYEVIGERTGRSLPSIRAYVHKALTRLRQDRVLLDILGYESPPSGSEVGE